MRTTYDFAPLWRSTIGFDRLFDLVDAAQHAGTEENYPPCNVDIKLREDDSERSTIGCCDWQPTSLSLCSEMCGSLPNCSRCPASRRAGSLPRKGR